MSPPLWKSLMRMHRIIRRQAARISRLRREIEKLKQKAASGATDTAIKEELPMKNFSSDITIQPSAQLSPISSELEGLAVSIGILAGKVSQEQWEFLKIFRANLRAAAERVAALENMEFSHDEN